MYVRVHESGKDVGAAEIHAFAPRRSTRRGARRSLRRRARMTLSETTSDASLEVPVRREDPPVFEDLVCHS